ncbi:inositol 1,4,5-triphosphate receptor associated 2-like [Watersipora subatra]|uniref:inositol 1,4,5-triphosphate receptor associated 2-like n=1 Tax=Watersipora subatra TaxID=2589382 RepID=UPI00355B2994
MGPPTDSRANHLLGVPNHFLSSATPDVTRSSEEEQSDAIQSSPDLLRVETKEGSMAPLSSPVKQETVSVAKCVSDGKLETAESSEAVSQSQRIYGRFSTADEFMVKEKKVEELESKFVFLTSGLDTQKETLDRRMELSLHTRASTEECLQHEVNDLLEEIRALITKDTGGLFKDDLRSVEKRLQNIMPIAIKLASKAEIAGAVKQEHLQLNAAQSMVEYVEHLKRIHTRETNDHHATRVKLLKAKQEWNVDGGDNSVNVNITRRSSTMGGPPQTLNKRRASVSITALPNILGGQGLKQLSADPRSKFQQMVRKSSLSNAFRRTSEDSTSSDYTELPAVTLSKPDSPDSVGSSMRPRFSSFSAGDRYSLETNNNSPIDALSHVAVIKTICAATPSVETVEKPEKGAVRTAIRRRKSIKRLDTSSSRGNVGSLKENYTTLNREYPGWQRHLRQIFLLIAIVCFYLRMNILLSTSQST